MNQESDSKTNASGTVPPSSESAAPKGRPKVAMPKTVLWAMAGGITAGIIFGEWTSYLKPLADIYIGLLQMMVLPDLEDSGRANIFQTRFQVDF